jgi:hypothetical protein
VFRRQYVPTYLCAAITATTKEIDMTANATARPARTADAPLLRLALKFDALAAGGLGLALVALGAVLDSTLGLPTSLLLPVGAFLLGWAGVVLYVGTRPAINRTAAWTIVALNALWLLDSVLVLVAGWYDVTGMGIAFVIAQALAVAVLTELQFTGLKRSA